MTFVGPHRAVRETFTIVSSADTPANVATVLAKWYRDKCDTKFMCLDVHLTFSGASGGATPFQIDLPILDGAQLEMEASELGGSFGSTNATRSHLGMGTWFLSGTGWIHVEVNNADAVAGSCTKIQFAYSSQVLNESQLTTNGALRFQARIPIKGWT